MLKTKLSLLAVAVALTTATATAHASDSYTVGIMAGTTGVGVEGSWRFHDRFSVTANYAGGLDYSGDFDTDDADYTGDLSLQAGMLKVDYYPFAGRFFLTAGAVLPDMTASVTGRARTTQGFELNGTLYDTDDVGTLNGEVVIADSIQPYLGLGWRSSNSAGFGLFSEIGVFTTDVDVQLSSSAGLENRDPAFRADLREEESQLRDDADSFAFYPVATLGVTYTF